MGIVYKGKLLSLKIAKKQMFSHKFNNIEFIKEIQITNRYRNIKTPCVLGIFEEKTHIKPFFENSIILERIEGSSLKKHISKLNKNLISLPSNELLYLLLMIDLASGMEFLHNNLLIHRDIKPDNIIVSNNYDLKIIDFGISKKMSGSNESTQTNDKGTLLYEPPEIFQVGEEEDLTKTDLNDNKKKHISRAFDIWSFGLVLCEIFGSQPPWGDPNIKGNSIMMNLISQKIYPIPTHLSKDIHKLIEECTRVDPLKRIKIKDLKERLIVIFIDRLIKYSKVIDLQNDKKGNIDNNKETDDGKLFQGKHGKLT